MFGRWRRQAKINDRIWEHLDTLMDHRRTQTKVISQLRVEHEALAAVCAAESRSAANNLQRIMQLSDEMTTLRDFVSEQDIAHKNVVLQKKVGELKSQIDSLHDAEKFESDVRQALLVIAGEG